MDIRLNQDSAMTNPMFHWPLRIYWEDTDTRVLQVWTC
jgi:hypothetical protein